MTHCPTCGLWLTFHGLSQRPWARWTSCSRCEHYWCHDGDGKLLRTSEREPSKHLFPTEGDTWR